MQTAGLPYPVTKHPNGLFRSQKGLNVVKGDLLILLLTNPGERVMLPSYGTNLRQYMFRPNNESVAEEVRDEIIRAIDTWEPRITVDSIEVTSNINRDDLNPEDSLDQEGHILMIKIAFYDPDNIAEVDELVLNLPLDGEV
jgi:phage baseplate assembly protein W